MRLRQCGGARLRKLGEVVSKTLECEPRRWKIIERVREKFACRDCEASASRRRRRIRSRAASPARACSP